MRHIRPASSTSFNFISLLLSYSLIITLFAPFAVRKAQATPSAEPRPAALGAKPSKEKGGRREGQLLVRFREDVSEQDKNAFVESRGGRRAKKLRGESRLEQMEVQA